MWEDQGVQGEGWGLGGGNGEGCVAVKRGGRLRGVVRQKGVVGGGNKRSEGECEAAQAASKKNGGGEKGARVAKRVERCEPHKALAVEENPLGAGPQQEYGPCNAKEMTAKKTPWSQKKNRRTKTKKGRLEKVSP